MIIIGYLRSIYLLTVYLTPGIDDISQDERYEERDPEHGVEGEITAA